MYTVSDVCRPACGVSVVGKKSGSRLYSGVFASVEGTVKVARQMKGVRM